MKLKLFALFVTITASTIITPAQINWGRVIQGAQKIGQAITVSDEQINAYVAEYIAKSDKENKVSAPDSKYTKRLERLTSGITNVEGLPLNFKVYETDEVNAFACADGSVRVYSGLMDIMSDDEVLGVIGHEMGHVAHHDTKRAFKQALINSALKDGLASTSSKIASLTDSQLGILSDALASARFSKKQEQQADDFGYDFLKANGKNPTAMVLAFRRLQQLENASGQTSNFVNQLFSSHPDIASRIKRMEKRANKDGYTIDK